MRYALALFLGWWLMIMVTALVRPARSADMPSRPATFVERYGEWTWQWIMVPVWMHSRQSKSPLGSSAALKPSFRKSTR